MKKTVKTIVRAISLTLAAIMIAASFAGCSLQEMGWRTEYFSILKQLKSHYGDVRFTVYNMDEDDNPELIVHAYNGDEGFQDKYMLFDGSKEPVTISEGNGALVCPYIDPYESDGRILVVDDYYFRQFHFVTFKVIYYYDYGYHAYTLKECDYDSLDMHIIYTLLDEFNWNYNIMNIFTIDYWVSSPLMDNNEFVIKNYVF